MGCIVELKAPLQFEFNSEGTKQKILVDILLKYGEQDIASLASILDATSNELQDILNGNYFFTGRQKDDLSHLFLIFFGETFFNRFTLIRNF